MEDHYIGVNILLPRWKQRARGHVLTQSHDASENLIGMAHANPILDTRINQIKFTGGKVTELTANKIAMPMYAQCDAEGNE